ncbi:response regulator [Leptolyngbya cf. ectocarpi LEGE 11479]|uniref:histidine kinase n=1 Tax=Leptolyngbya cf. ectocarpi LEGE 11479 TaxID=1828722 RepID=A0A929FAA3_LEPEC|nr:response regulator [Leptolyngbya ectocarpi]MBE9067838.1 response regulator [Leptolyngbya cf. ectocarpi LEGE 11479]
MTIDPDIRDQAYQFFIEEASELLDIIETGLLNLRSDTSVQKVHEIMRAAHSIKGGAASVELEVIKTIAHRLEDAFKALYSDTVVVDEKLETLLLRAYDCLRHPLQSQIDNGTFNEPQALAAFNAVFSELEDCLGPALDQTDSFMPSAADLGVDIVASIFEVDVADVLTRLRQLLAHPQDYDCAQELQTQIEVLVGFAELVDLPGFTALMATAQAAADRQRHRPRAVIEQIVLNVDNARTAVLAGERGAVTQPSDILCALASGAIANQAEPTHSDGVDPIDMFDLADLDLEALDETTNYDLTPVTDPAALSNDTAEQLSTLEEIWSIEAIDFPSVERIDEQAEAAPSTVIDALTDIWGDAEAPLDVEVTDFESVVADTPSAELIDAWPPHGAEEDDTNNIPDQLEEADSPDDAAAAVAFINNVYDSLPTLEPEPTPTAAPPKPPIKSPAKSPSSSRLSAKVALERLERMDNLVGELAINRNSLSLQNDQFQRTVHRLGRRFSSFRIIVKQLQSVSDQLLISPERQRAGVTRSTGETTFDTLEMDSYSEINSLLEGVLEEVFQLAESIEDVGLFAGQSNQLLEHQRRTLDQLRDELMWSRMVPLDRVLKRFPRVIRELATTYQKPVQLTLTGTEVLVDRVMLEKLYDPLLHLLRNAFDHGIETPEERQRLGKPKQGTIEIRAYHQGNYTVVEVEDDGRGLDFDIIAQRAIEAQLLSPEQLATISKQRIQELIFEPGFSTAREVSELSGRGVGLDVVRDSLQSFNGKLSLTTHQDKGTVFSLKIPLTLTLTKLVVGNVGSTAVALASDSIEEILRPVDAQLKQSGGKQFLHWRDQLIPIYEMAELLSYQCQMPDQLPQELQARQRNKGNIMLIIQQGQGRLALGLEQIVTEQELVIKPMGKAIVAPGYINGCTVLADGSLVPVIDSTALVQFEPAEAEQSFRPSTQPQQAQTVMIIDDSSALRRTLALTLHKAGYRVLQAKDGRDGLEQLKRGVLPELIICDVEMPRLNGFEFLSQRRTNVAWADIPTIMLTSRGNHKHRNLAKHLGATDYFTKPYIEKDFVGAIATLLQRHP